MVCDKSWAVDQLVVESGTWFSGKEILIPSANIERISYVDSQVFVNLTRDTIRHTAEHAVVQARA